jgi:hypothetical protein
VNVFKFGNTNALYSYVIDMNNDGYLDAVSFACSGVYVSLGTGNGMLTNEKILWTDKITTCASNYNSTAPPQRFLIDVDGNLSPDIVAFDQNTLKIFFSSQNNVPVLSELTDSLGNLVKIQYGFNSESGSGINEQKNDSGLFSRYGVNKEIVKCVQRSAPNLINQNITSRTAFYTYGKYKKFFLIKYEI